MVALPLETLKLIFCQLQPAELYPLLCLGRSVYPTVKALMMQKLDFRKHPQMLPKLMWGLSLQNAATRQHSCASVKSIYFDFWDPEYPSYGARDPDAEEPSGEEIITFLWLVQPKSLGLTFWHASGPFVQGISNAVDARALHVLELSGFGECFECFFYLAKGGLPNLVELALSIGGSPSITDDMRTRPLLPPIKSLRKFRLHYSDSGGPPSISPQCHWQWAMGRFQELAAEHITGSLSVEAHLDCEHVLTWQVLGRTLGVHVSSVASHSDSFLIGSQNVMEALPNLQRFSCYTETFHCERFAFPSSITTVEIRTNSLLTKPNNDESLQNLAKLENLRSLAIRSPGLRSDGFDSYARLRSACEQRGIDFSLAL